MPNYSARFLSQGRALFCSDARAGRSSASPAPTDTGEGRELDAHGSTGFGPRKSETWHLMNPAVSYIYKTK